MTSLSAILSCRCHNSTLKGGRLGRTLGFTLLRTLEKLMINDANTRIKSNIP